MFVQLAGTRTSNAAINATYTDGPLYATLHAQQVRVGPGIVDVGLSAQRSYFVGAGYKFALARLYASYDLAKDTEPDKIVKHAQLGVAVPASGGDILLSIARARNSLQTAGARTRDTVGVGYDYKLSVRTDVYVNALYDQLQATGSGTSFGAGIRHRF